MASLRIESKVFKSMFVFLNSIQRKIQIYQALILQHAISHYGRENFGFLWLIFAPSFLVFGVIILWRFVVPHGAGGYMHHNIPIADFAFTGYLNLTLYRHCIFTVNMLKGRSYFLYHTDIKPIDILLSFCIGEFIAMTTVLFLIYVCLYSIGWFIPIANYPEFLLGWLLSFWYCTAFGCVLGMLSVKSHVIGIVNGPIQYLMLPLSGIFTSVAWLPKKMQDILLWSPQVNLVELFRGGYFGPDFHAQYDIGYTVICCLIMTVISIFFSFYVRKWMFK